MQRGKTPVQRRNNPHVIPIRDTCYHCNGRGHKSNVFPTRKDVVIAKEREWEEEREKPAVENNEYAGVKFAEEEFDVRINFMLHRTLIASKEEGQHMNLFKTHCYIENKVCNLIVDSGKMENMVSQKLIDYLKLSIEPHENP